MQGANVVAIWILVGGYTGSPTGIIKVTEAITDKNGRFSIGWWGPRIPLAGRFTVNTPEIIIFSPDHRSRVLNNSKTLRMPLSPLQSSDWDNTIIELNRISTTEDRLNNAKYAQTHLEYTLTYAGCYWESAPNAWLAIIHEGETLRSLGGNARWIINRENFIKRVSCGDPQELFEQ